jgi:hypothetical protein
MMTSIGQQVGRCIEREPAEESLARRAAELADVNAELETFRSMRARMRAASRRRSS